MSAIKTAVNGETSNVNCTVPELWATDVIPYRIYDYEYQLINNYRMYGCNEDNCKERRTI